MKHFRKVLVPSTEKQVHTHTTCDICKETLTEGTFEVKETEISCRVGERYPGGGSIDNIEVDMCVDCFRFRLVPWLMSQGCTPKTTNTDY